MTAAVVPSGEKPTHLKQRGAFEARHPREKAVISEVDGTVHHGPVVKGLRRVIVETDEGTRHEYSVPRSCT